MKKLIVVIPLFISSFLYGNIYYVATGGNDYYPGTINLPWRTWQKAFSSAFAGDTVFFRGGIYPSDSTVECSVSGSKSNLIYFLNYSGEVPILDGMMKLTGSSGIVIDNMEYLHLKGLTVRNNNKILSTDEPSGILITACNNVTIENCTSYNNGKFGFLVYGTDSVTILNSDSYNNVDTISYDDPGDGGDGFIINNDGTNSDPRSYIGIIGCRSWNNSGDGFDLRSAGTVRATNCWSWNNSGFGFDLRSARVLLPLSPLDSDGKGIDGKGSGPNVGSMDLLTITNPGIQIFNCISFINDADGFAANEGNPPGGNVQIFNNSSYRNLGYGFSIFNSSGVNWQENIMAYKNNLSFEDESGEVYIKAGAVFDSEINSWDNDFIPIISVGDFLSIDPAGSLMPRQPNGSLPDSDFLRLSSNSDLIDAGTVNTGLYFCGEAPEPGAYELCTDQGDEFPYVSITEPRYNDHFAAPSDITVTAIANDVDGTISNVEFYQGFTQIVEISTAPWSFLWRDVPDGEYTLTAVATDNMNNSATSARVIIVVGDEKDEKITITGYPNPTHGQINVYFEGGVPDGATLFVCDFLGRIVYNQELDTENPVDIDLSNCINGIYIINIQTDKERYSKKLIINR